MENHDNPIKMFLHGFTSSINNKIGAIVTIPDMVNPETGDCIFSPEKNKLRFSGTTKDMLPLIAKWQSAGEPRYCYWYPNANSFSLGFNL
tara:strand:- start:564 stop:833 length:270 start_codon:yes stop_codon:yes gene_type:complete